MAVPTVLATTARRSWIRCSRSDSGAVATVSIVDMVRSPPMRFGPYLRRRRRGRRHDGESAQHRSYAPVCLLVTDSKLQAHPFRADVTWRPATGCPRSMHSGISPPTAVWFPIGLDPLDQYRQAAGYVD